MIQHTMKKLTILLLLLSTASFAKEFMANIEPFEKYEIKSQISGVVHFVNTTLEESYTQKKSLLLHLDDTDEQIMLKKQQQNYALQKRIVKIKEQNFNAKNRVKQLSKYDKNTEELALLEAKKTLYTLEQEIKTLKQDIAKKHFHIQNRYIHDVKVNQDEYVNVGDTLFELYDISKQKITLYLTQNEIESLEDKHVYINGVKSNFTLHKASRVKDSVKISRYKAEFTAPLSEKTYYFNDVVKVELK